MFSSNLHPCSSLLRLALLCRLVDCCHHQNQHQHYYIVVITVVIVIISRNLVLSSSEFLSIGEVVDGDGEEDVEQGVVPKQGEHDEVEAENDDIYECCEGVGKKVARQ